MMSNKIISCANGITGRKVGIFMKKADFIAELRNAGVVSVGELTAQYEQVVKNGAKLDAVKYMTDDGGVFVYIAGHDISGDASMQDVLEKLMPDDQIIQNVGKLTKTLMKQVDVNNLFPALTAANNAEYLKDKPHRIIADDLAIYYRLEISNNAGSIATSAVNYGLMKKLNMDEDALYNKAVQNVKLRVECMSKVLGMPPAENEILFVARTNRDNYGAAMAFIDTNALHEFGEDMWVIPSSVHEAIYVKGDFDKEALTSLIVNVNAHEVPPEEVLSSHPYKYIYKENKLIAC